MADTNYPDWLTREESARVIGVSTKTVEKLERDKKLHRKDRKRAGKPPIAVYHPADVQKMAEEYQRSSEPGILPPELAQMPASSPAPLAVRSQVPGGFLEALAQISNKLVVRVSERLYLKIAEASLYSGLPQAYLKRLIREGKLSALRTGAGWRIKRCDLEAL